MNVHVSVISRKVNSHVCVYNCDTRVNKHSMLADVLRFHVERPLSEACIYTCGIRIEKRCMLCQSLECNTIVASRVHFVI